MEPAAVALRLAQAEAGLAALVEPWAAALEALRVVKAAPLSVAIRLAAAARLPGEPYLKSAEPLTAAPEAMQVAKAAPPSAEIRFAAGAALPVEPRWASAPAPAARDLRAHSRVHCH